MYTPIRSIGSRVTLHSSSFGSKLKVKSSKLDIRKKGLKLSYATSIPECLFPKEEELKEDFKNDTFSYCLYDEVVDRVLEEIKRKRLTEESINRFVESFSRAWLKLVKWRWMMKDMKKNTLFEETGPMVCPKDAWSSHSYCEPTVVWPRTTLPPPRKCYPHPPIRTAEEYKLEKVIMGNVRRTTKRMREYEEKSRGANEPQRRPSSRPTIKSKRTGNDMVGYNKLPLNSKSAFPERASARVYMGPQLHEKRNAMKMHVSKVDL